jgi:hypothetical protein
MQNIELVSAVLLQLQAIWKEAMRLPQPPAVFLTTA